MCELNIENPLVADVVHYWIGIRRWRMEQELEGEAKLKKVAEELEKFKKTRNKIVGKVKAQLKEELKRQDQECESCWIDVDDDPDPDKKQYELAGHKVSRTDVANLMLFAMKTQAW